jgi:hypothetical protein
MRFSNFEVAIEVASGFKFVSPTQCRATPFWGTRFNLEAYPNENC